MRSKYTNQGFKAAMRRQPMGGKLQGVLVLLALLLGAVGAMPGATSAVGGPDKALTEALGPDLPLQALMGILTLLQSSHKVLGEQPMIESKGKGGTRHKQ